MIYEKRNAKVISTLHPAVAAMAKQFESKLQTAKREVLFTSGSRTPAAQQLLWESGRLRPGPIVTGARGKPKPESLHCFGVALDFCPVDAKGNCLWKDAEKFWTYAQVAKLCGFSWGGDWKGSLKDGAHLQYTGGLSLADFQRGKTLPPNA